MGILWQWQRFFHNPVCRCRAGSTLLVDFTCDLVGSDDLVERIQGGFFDFDATIATPDQMAKVGRVGKVLGLSELQVSRLARSMQWWDGKRVDDSRVLEAGLDPEAPPQTLAVADAVLAGYLLRDWQREENQK